jgi:tetratricopeptide (TPR) repeat protein
MGQKPLVFGTDPLNEQEAKEHLELGKKYLSESDLPKAKRIFTAIVDSQSDSPDNQIVADALCCLGVIAEAQGDLASAEARIACALNVYQRSNSTAALIECHEILGRIYIAAQKQELAEQTLRSAIALPMSDGQVTIISRIYANLAFIHRSRNDLREAASLLLKAIQLAKRSADNRLLANHYSALAAISLTQNCISRARILLRAAQALMKNS